MATKTKKSERIMAILAGIVLIISTIGLYFGMILSTKNEEKDLVAQQDQMKKMNEFSKRYQTVKERIAKKESDRYYSIFKEYENYPTAYNAASITEVKTKDLKVGDGKEITKETPYRAYYIGWLNTGKVFDSSFKGTELKSPIEGGNLIEGWNEGVIGMKINGIREIEIPYAKAYKDQAQGDIPAKSPLKFVVMAIAPENEKDSDVIELRKIEEEFAKAYGQR